MGALWLITRLPFGMQLRLGRLMGRLGYRVIRSRRRIAARNIALCLPELDAAARERLVRAHFESFGMGIVELAMSWWTPASRLAGRLQVEGLEHLQQAQQEGRGVMLVSAHFTSIDVSGRLFRQVGDIDVLYRRHENPVIEHFMSASRARLFRHAIDRSDVRGMIRALKAGRAVWYAPDQNYRGKQSAMVPFFGIPASTNTGTARIARLTGALVIPLFMARTADYSGYRVRLLPPLEDFPSADPIADTARINALIEAEIRRVPAQYFWLHRRFKRRPPGYPDLYA